MGRRYDHLRQQCWHRISAHAVLATVNFRRKSNGSPKPLQLMKMVSGELYSSGTLHIRAAQYEAEILPTRPTCIFHRANQHGWSHIAHQDCSSWQTFPISIVDYIQPYSVSLLNNPHELQQMFTLLLTMINLFFSLLFISNWIYQWVICCFYLHIKKRRLAAPLRECQTHLYNSKEKKEEKKKKERKRKKNEE